MNSQTQAQTRNEIGASGEAAAREFVAAHGWTVIDHNVSWREGELDMIALDGSTLVFAEVKTLVARGRDGRSAFSPFESIDHRKQRQVRSLARRWLVDELRMQDHPNLGRFGAIRFDAFAVTMAPHGEVLEIEHLEDAF